MARAARLKRAARNERRGRKPERRPTVLASERARYFRYGGWVVRVLRGEISVVRPFGRPVRALKSQYPRAAMAYAPLRLEHREEIAAAARAETRRQRDKRLKEMGVELPERTSIPDKPVYEKPVAVPSGAWT